MVQTLGQMVNSYFQDRATYASRMISEGPSHKMHYAATSEMKLNEFERKALARLQNHNLNANSSNYTSATQIDYFNSQALDDLIKTYETSEPLGYAKKVGRSLEKLARTVPGIASGMTNDEILQIAKILKSQVTQTGYDLTDLENKIAAQTGDVEKALVGFAAKYDNTNAATRSTIDSDMAYQIRTDSGKNWMDVIRPSKSVKAIATTAAIVVAPYLAGGAMAALAAYGISKGVGAAVGVTADTVAYAAGKFGYEKAANVATSVGQMAMYGLNNLWMVAPVVLKIAGEAFVNYAADKRSSGKKFVYQLGKAASVLADYAQIGVLAGSKFLEAQNEPQNVPVGNASDPNAHANGNPAPGENNGPMQYQKLSDGHDIRVERAIAISPSDADKSIVDATHDLNNNTWFPAYHQPNDSVIVLAQQDANGVHLISSNYVALNPDGTNFQALTNDFGETLAHTTVSNHSVATWQVNTSLDIYDGKQDGVFENVLPVLMHVNQDGTFSNANEISFTVPHLAIDYAGQPGNMFATNTNWVDQQIYQPFVVSDANAHAFAGQQPDGPHFITALTLFEHKAATQNEIATLYANSQNIPEVVSTTTSGVVYCNDSPWHNGQIWPENANSGFRLATGIPMNVWDNSYNPAESTYAPVTVTSWHGIWNFSSGEANYNSPMGNWWPSFTGFTRTDQFRDYPLTSWDDLLHQMGALLNFPASSHAPYPQHFEGNYNTEEMFFCGAEKTINAPPQVEQGGWNTGGGPGEPTDPPGGPLPPGTP